MVKEAAERVVEEAVEAPSSRMPGSLHAHLALLWGAHPAWCTGVRSGWGGPAGASWFCRALGRGGELVSCPHWQSAKAPRAAGAGTEFPANARVSASLPRGGRCPERQVHAGSDHKLQECCLARDPALGGREQGDFGKDLGLLWQEAAHTMHAEPGPPCCRPGPGLGLSPAPRPRPDVKA